jgi:hypothetical protein|tara:strand:- start:23 stop:259 length:237 start_codon:yes stop_codon:yes gene_type:complete
MKIEINLYDETGQQVVGKAIETNCQSLIINGQHVIANGGVNSEMRDLMSAPSVAEQLVPADLRYDPNALSRLGLDDQS